MIGLGYIGLSILCSLILAQILKIAESRELNVLRILVINYLVAFCISFINWGLQGPISPIRMKPIVVLLMLLLGFMFIANLVVYSRSIHRVGMGISFAAMRMSLIFPIAVSLFVFGEHIVLLKYAGIILALLSLLFMLPPVHKNKVTGYSDLWLPIGIFLMTGFADTGMKVYEEIFSQKVSEHLFLGGIFLFSFLTGVLVLMRRKSLAINFTEVMYGMLAGIVNLYASVFLIQALKILPGSVVFPLINVTLVVVGTFVGIWFWKDSLSIRQWIGLSIAIISILVLI